MPYGGDFIDNDYSFVNYCFHTLLTYVHLYIEQGFSWYYQYPSFLLFLVVQGFRLVLAPGGVGEHAELYEFVDCFDFGFSVGRRFIVSCYMFFLLWTVFLGTAAAFSEFRKHRAAQQAGFWRIFALNVYVGAYMTIFRVLRPELVWDVRAPVNIRFWIVLCFLPFDSAHGSLLLAYYVACVYALYGFLVSLKVTLDAVRVALDAAPLEPPPVEGGVAVNPQAGEGRVRDRWTFSEDLHFHSVAPGIEVSDELLAAIVEDDGLLSVGDTDDSVVHFPVEMFDDDSAWVYDDDNVLVAVMLGDSRHVGAAHYALLRGAEVRWTADDGIVDAAWRTTLQPLFRLVRYLRDGRYFPGGTLAAMNPEAALWEDYIFEINDIIDVLCVEIEGVWAEGGYDVNVDFDGGNPVLDIRWLFEPAEVDPQGSWFSAPVRVVTPPVSMPVEGSPASPGGASVEDNVNPQAGGGRTCGVRVFGQFISRHYLKRVKTVDGADLKPVYVVCMGEGGRVEDRLWNMLARIEREWLKKMVKACVPQLVDPQGLTISCPRVVRVDAVALARFWECLFPEQTVSEFQMETLSLTTVEEVDPQMGGLHVNTSPWNVTLTATYAVVRGMSEDVFGDKEIYNFVLDGLDLAKAILSVDDLTDALVTLDRFHRRWGRFFGEWASALNVSVGPQAGLMTDIRDQILSRLFEGMVVVAVCRMLGITKELGDVKSLGVYLKEYVVAGTHHLFAMIFAVVRIFASGDWSHFGDRVHMMTGDRESLLMGEFQAEFTLMKMREPAAGEMGSRVTHLALLARRVRELEQQSKAYGREVLSQRAKVLAGQIDVAREEVEETIASRGIRKEPLMLVCISPAGTGKSLIGLVLENALARALDVPPEEARFVVSTWAMGEKFQETWNGQTRAIVGDELLSVDPDYDPNVASTLYMFLGLGSAVPAPIPHAFESKGKYTTRNVLAVSVNTNGNLATFKRLYAGGGENFIRRAVFVEMKPQDVALKDGRFSPGDVPEVERDLKGLARYMHVEAYRSLDGGETRSVVFKGDILGFTDFVYDEVCDRLDGASASVGRWLNNLRFYKTAASSDVRNGVAVNPQSSLVIDVVQMSAIFVFCFWAFREFRTHVVLLAPRVWQVYWAYLWVAANLCGWREYIIRFFALGAPLTNGGIRAVARLRARAEQLRWTQIRSRASALLRSEAAVGIAVVVGVIGAGCAFSMALEKLDPVGAAQAAADRKIGLWNIFVKGEEAVNAQAFRMPLHGEVTRSVEPDVAALTELLVPRVENVKGKGKLQPLYKFGTGMRAPEVDKLRANMVCVDVFTPGLDEPNSVYGASMGGVLLTVAHPFDKKPILGSVLKVFRPLVPGQVQQCDLRSNVRILSDEDDVAFATCVMPSGVKDIFACLQTAGAAVREGDEVICIHPDAARDLVGRVEMLNVPTNYGARDGRRMHVPCYGIRWKDGARSVNGDCGRWVLRKSGGGLGLIGLLTGELIGQPGISTVSMLSADDLRRRVVEARLKLSIIPEMTIVPQCSMAITEEYPEIEAEYPEKGVFAYPELCKDFGVRVIGRSGVQVPANPSRLVSTPFSETVEEFAEEHFPGVEYAPAVQTTVLRYDPELAANRFVSPWEVGLHRDEPHAVVDLDALREFEEVFGAAVDAKLSGSSWGLLTVDQALERRVGLAPVDPTKAAALPEPGKKGAFMLESFHPDEGLKRFADERLRGSVEELAGRLASGEMVFGRSRSSLKDEAVEMRKIAAVKTRIFECIPFDQYLLNRMVFGEFVSHLVAALRDFGCCIGINASSRDWAWVNEKTGPHVKGVLKAIDYERYDKNFVYLIHLFVLGLIVRWWRKHLKVESSNEVVWRLASLLLWMELAVQRQVDGTYTLSYIGNGSGSFWTTLVNTVVGMVYLFLGYRRVSPAFPVRVFVSDVLRHSALYGDDLRKVFRYPEVDVESLKLAMVSLGQVLTDSNGQKGDLLVDSGGGKTFLKRGFRTDEHGRVLCPLEVSSIVKSLLFFTPSGDHERDDVRHIMTLTTAWDECFFHEARTRDLVRGLILECLRRVRGGTEVKMTSDEELAARWDAGRLRVWEL